MYYTIYKATNTINGKYYIGKHKTKKQDDMYYGSGKAILLAIKKYGKDNFKKEILYELNSQEEMNEKERSIVNQDIVNDSMSYNMMLGGQGSLDYINSLNLSNPMKDSKIVKKEF